MADLLKEVMSRFPEEKITEGYYEASNIVLYTNDRDYILDSLPTVLQTVKEFKKRIEIRGDPSILMPEEEAEQAIRKIIPEEAGVDQILFEHYRSIVHIEAYKPGHAIGPKGEVLNQIKRETGWTPVVKRKPAIRSKIIESIRAVLYQESEYRRKFLHDVGKRIYSGWTRERKQEWARITMLGSGRHVGRSSILFQTEESRILLDCGVDVANTREPYPFLDAPEFRLNELDAIILSHAHLDHSGFIPYLYKMGYRGPVYMTEPTRDVAALLLLDYIKIMRQDRKDPIFDIEHVKEMVKHTITLNYEEVSDITPDIRITLYNAGHTLGSAQVHVHVGNGLHNFLYTADIKFGKTALLDPAVHTFPRVESMLMESTYGGRENVLPRKDENDALFIGKLREVIQRGGKVLIPVLGVGRAQEIIVVVEDAIKRGDLPEVPIYVDGMVWDVTAIHTAYPEYLNRRVRKRIFHEDDNPFLNPLLRQVGSQKERLKVVEEEGPCIILATSGMLTGGPSVEYLKHLGVDAKNALFFVSYQSEGSLGRRIQRGEREITFAEGAKTETFLLRCEVETFEGFSGHSDRRQLMSFAGKVTPRPKKIILNHGEASRALDLASSIHRAYKIETIVPRNLEAVRLR